MKKLFAILILLAITLLVVVAFAASGNPAPADLTIATSDGEELSLMALLAQHDYVILNIFQPENAASSMELSWFENIYASLPRGIEVVAVTTRSVEALAAFKTPPGLSFPIGSSTDLTAYLAGKGLPDSPNTLVLNSQGSIVYTQSGYFRLQSQLQSVVDYFSRIPDSPAVTTYNVIVLDASNQPVPGVVLSFYGAGTGQMCVSGDDGVISFTTKPAAYHFQVISVPEGYELDGAFEGTCDGNEWVVVHV